MKFLNGIVIVAIICCSGRSLALQSAEITLDQIETLFQIYNQAVIPPLQRAENLLETLLCDTTMADGTIDVAAEANLLPPLIVSLADIYNSFGCVLDEIIKDMSELINTFSSALSPISVPNSLLYQLILELQQIKATAGIGSNALIDLSKNVALLTQHGIRNGSLYTPTSVLRSIYDDLYDIALANKNLAPVYNAIACILTDFQNQQKLVIPIGPQKYLKYYVGSTIKADVIMTKICNTLAVKLDSLACSFDIGQSKAPWQKLNASQTFGAVNDVLALVQKVIGGLEITLVNINRFLLAKYNEAAESSSS